MPTHNARHAQLEDEPMPSEQYELQQRARLRIREGLLPCITHYRTWGGHGSNQPCALCDIVIRSDEVEYEIEAPDGDGARAYRFHFPCHDAWQTVCVEAS